MRSSILSPKFVWFQSLDCEAQCHLSGNCVLFHFLWALMPSDFDPLLDSFREHWKVTVDWLLITNISHCILLAWLLSIYLPIHYSFINSDNNFLNCLDTMKTKCIVFIDTCEQQHSELCQETLNTISSHTHTPNICIILMYSEQHIPLSLSCYLTICFKQMVSKVWDLTKANKSY